MNIKVQACGFVLLVILYLLYHQQHTLQTYSQRAFLRFYAVTVLCILMDILSIVAIESASHLPALFVTFVCSRRLQRAAHLPAVQYTEHVPLCIPRTCDQGKLCGMRPLRGVLSDRCCKARTEAVHKER